MVKWAVPYILNKATYSGYHGEHEETPDCPICNSEQLTDDEWVIINYFYRVQQYFRNQTPMGNGEGRPAVLSPVLSDWLATLEIYQYPKGQWPIIVDNALTLFNYWTEQEKTKLDDSDPLEYPAEVALTPGEALTLWLS